MGGFASFNRELTLFAVVACFSGRSIFNALAIAKANIRARAFVAPAPAAKPDDLVVLGPERKSAGGGMKRNNARASADRICERFLRRLRPRAVVSEI
jgi:hypothetical protein